MLVKYLTFHVQPGEQKTKTAAVGVAWMKRRTASKF